MTTYQAQLKDAQRDVLLTRCSASFRKMPSFEPGKQEFTIYIWVKGIQTDLAEKQCILWINEKINGPVKLSNLEFHPETDESKFQAVPGEAFSFGSA